MLERIVIVDGVQLERVDAMRIRIRRDTSVNHTTMLAAEIDIRNIYADGQPEGNQILDQLAAGSGGKGIPDFFRMEIKTLDAEGEEIECTTIEEAFIEKHKNADRKRVSDDPYQETTIRGSGISQAQSDGSTDALMVPGFLTI